MIFLNVPYFNGVYWLNTHKIEVNSLPQNLETLCMKEKVDMLFFVCLNAPFRWIDDLQFSS